MTGHGDPAVTIESLPHDSTGPRFAGALALRNRLHAERDPRLDPDTAEQFRRAIAGTPTFDQELLLAIEADEVVGLAAVHLHRIGSSSQIAEIEIEVDEPHRRRGFGRTLLDAALGVAARDGRTMYTAFGVRSDATAGFWAAQGAELRSVEVQSRSWIADIDETLMMSWIERGSRNDDVETVEFYEGVTPARLRPAAATLLTAANDAPTDELETEHLDWTEEDVIALDEMVVGRGRTKWTMLALGPGGEPMGYTTISLQHEKPRFCNQGVTAVGNTHRRKGVGRLLKALMWRRLREHAPEVEAIDTDNAASNDSMLNDQPRDGVSTADRMGGLAGADREGC